MKRPWVIIIFLLSAWHEISVVLAGRDFAIMIQMNETALLSRDPEGSTNQTYSTCFQFRISWILLEGPIFFFIPVPLDYYRTFKKRRQNFNFQSEFSWSKKYQIILKLISFMNVKIGQHFFLMTRTIFVNNKKRYSK